MGEGTRGETCKQEEEEGRNRFGVPYRLHMTCSVAIARTLDGSLGLLDVEPRVTEAEAAVVSFVL